MTAKENLYRYYHHQTFEVMPLFGEGEHSFYPVNGFLERPPMNGGERTGSVVNGFTVNWPGRRRLLWSIMCLTIFVTGGRR